MLPSAPAPSPGPLEASPVRPGRALRFLLPLWAVTLAVRVVHLLAFRRDAAFFLHENADQTDAFIFYRWAEHLAQGDWLGRAPYHPIEAWQLGIAPAAQWEAWYGAAPTYFKAPLYAYLVALLKLAFSEPIVPLVLLQFVAALGSVTLLFLLSKELFDERVGLLAAGLYGLFAPAVHYDLAMLRGPWIVLAGLAVTWLLLRVLDRPTPGLACGLGAATGVGILFNEAFGMWVVFLPAALWLGLGRKHPSRDLVRWTGTFFVGLLAALAPVFVRNLLVGAPMLKVAATGGMLAVHNAPSASAYFFHPRDVAKYIEAGRGGFFATFLACLKDFSGPGAFLSLYVQRFLGILAPFENADNFNFYYAALRSPLLRWLPDFTWLAPLGLVGASLAFRKPSRRMLALAPFFVATLVALMITAPLSRYRATLVPIFCIFAAVALRAGSVWAQSRRWRPYAAAVIATLALAWGLHEFQTQVIFRNGPDAPWRYRYLEFFVNAERDAKEGHFDQAASTLQEFAGLNRQPSAASASLLKAAGYKLQAGNVNAARAMAQAAVASTAEQADLLYQCGEFYRVQLADRPAAKSLYERAARGNPSPRVKARLDLFLSHPI